MHRGHVLVASTRSTAITTSHIAILLAEGLSSAAIAERLVLSEGTVANHIEHILRRLGLQSRTQVAVWAVERGLYRSD